MKKKQIKKFETGTFGVANNNNQAATERKLHQQNGTWSNLSAIPLIGKPLANGMNFMQGWGKAQYDRNESIANMKMDRLAGQAGAMQQSFSGQGMRNSISNTQFGNQDENDLYSTVNNKAKKGKNQMKDKALIEVEKDEFIFRPNGKGYKLVGDMKGGKTHEQGGEPVVAKEGDVIFPAKDRKLIAPLIGPGGSVRDLKRFEALRSRLPEDKPSDVRKGQMQAKATGGRIDGTGMDLREAFRKGCYAKKYEDGTRGVKIFNYRNNKGELYFNDPKTNEKVYYLDEKGNRYTGVDREDKHDVGNPIMKKQNTVPLNSATPKLTPEEELKQLKQEALSIKKQLEETKKQPVKKAVTPPLLSEEELNSLDAKIKELERKTTLKGFLGVGEKRKTTSTPKVTPSKESFMQLAKGAGKEILEGETVKNLKTVGKTLKKVGKKALPGLGLLGGAVTAAEIANYGNTVYDRLKTGKDIDHKTLAGDVYRLLGGPDQETIDQVSGTTEEAKNERARQQAKTEDIERTKRLAEANKKETPSVKPGEEYKKTLSSLNSKKVGGAFNKPGEAGYKDRNGKLNKNPFGVFTTPTSSNNTDNEETQPTQSSSSRSSSPSSYVPTPRYSKLHTTGVKRGKFQLEPTDAENKKYNPDDRRYDDEYSPEGVRTKKGKGANAGNYDDFKVSKIKEIREAGYDISEYEGANDIETFYNLYNDRKVNKPKSKEDKLLQEALREEEGNKPSITKPKPMEVDPDSKPPKIYQDEELPEWIPKKRIPEGKQYDSRKDKPGVTQKLPDRVEIERSETPKEYFERRTREDRNNAKKLKHGSKSLKEYSKGSYSVKHGVEHEQRELRNFDDIQKELNGLKRMHKGIPKAEQGMQSVFGVNTGVRQQDPPNNTASGPNMYVPAGVGSNAQGTLQPSSQPPVNKRPMTPMQGIAPMPVNAGNNANLWAHTSRPAYNDPNARLKQMTERDTTITPTMPTLEFPKETLGQKAKNAIRKGAKGGWGISGFDTAGFNQAVGLSRQRGDRYTDKYTDVAGGGRVNQYNKGVSSMKTCEDGSKKLKLRKYGWGTGFMETNKGETKKEREERKQLEREYFNSNISSMRVFGDTIDRSIKMKEDLEKREKKYEKGSYYLKTRSRVGKGSNKYNSTHVEHALANEGKNLSEDEKNYIRKFYKDRNYDVPQDPARLIDMYRYAGSNFKGGFDEYKSEFLKQKGHTLPYKTREEYVEDYVDNYGDKNYALHSSNRKESHRQYSPRDWNNSDVDNLGWELGTIIQENKTTVSQPGPGETKLVQVPGDSNVSPVHHTSQTERILARPMPPERSRISLGGPIGATAPIDADGDIVGGNMTGPQTRRGNVRNNRNNADGNRNNKYKGGEPGEGFDLNTGGPIGASAPITARGDMVGGNGALIPIIHKDGRVTFKAVKGGSQKRVGNVTGNTNNASGNTGNRIKLFGGLGKSRAEKEAERAKINAAIDAKILGANADAIATEKTARDNNEKSLTDLKALEEKYAKMGPVEKAKYDAEHQALVDKYKTEYDTTRSKARAEALSKSSDPDAAGKQFDQEYDAKAPYREPTKQEFLAGKLTGVDATRQAIQSANVGNTPRLTSVPADLPALPVKPSPDDNSGSGGQGNTYEGVVPPGAGGQGNTYKAAPQEKEINTANVNSPIAIGGNNDNDYSKNITKKSKFKIKGGAYPEDLEALKMITEARKAQHEATMTDRSNRSADRVRIAESRHASDTAIAQAVNSGGIVQGGNNTRVNSDNTKEEKEFRRGSKKLVLRKYEDGNKKLTKEEIRQQKEDDEFREKNGIKRYKAMREARIGPGAESLPEEFFGGEEQQSNLPGVKDGDYYKIDPDGVGYRVGPRGEKIPGAGREESIRMVKEGGPNIIGSDAYNKRIDAYGNISPLPEEWHGSSPDLAELVLPPYAPRERDKRATRRLTARPSAGPSGSYRTTDERYDKDGNFLPSMVEPKGGEMSLTDQFDPNRGMAKRDDDPTNPDYVAPNNSENKHGGLPGNSAGGPSSNPANSPAGGGTTYTPGQGSAKHSSNPSPSTDPASKSNPSPTSPGQGNSGTGTPLGKKILNTVNKINPFGRGSKNNNDESENIDEGFDVKINNRQRRRQENRTERARIRADRDVKKAEAKAKDLGYKLPKWKTPRDKNDPMVSPDDTTALKVSLNRNNYQDSSAPQRQEISSLMSGGGFDSANQIANKINKEKALSKVNADEQNRLAAVNQSNTAILNDEKVMNMKNMAQAIDEKAQNKGVADATNYNAVLRNNQRFNDKPMKDLNYNMARAQYAMMEPMMNLQIQQAEMANEYMKDGMKTPTPPTPTPSPAPTPTNPGAGWNANPASINSNTPTTGMGPNPAATAGGPPAANVTSNNFLQQMGFVNPRKGIKKLKLSKNSLIAKTVKK